MSKRSKTTKLPELKSSRKKNNRSVKGALSSTCEFCSDIAKFVFFGASIGAGYVLATQGATNMQVIGSILLAGGVVFFADKTFKK